VGARIGRAIGLPAEAVQIIALHHERWDGAGYPFALKETGIPYLARLVALAQKFDELTAEYPGAVPVPMKKALTLIESQSGTAFDPSLVEVFCTTIREQPPQK
jgi:putative two-component system response regulator